MSDETYSLIMREAAENRLMSEVERYEYSLISTLNLVPQKDGNAWFVLWGENLQVGISGFGDTPYKAILAFNRAMHTNRGAHND